jgi:replicative DNA helicase
MDSANITQPHFEIPCNIRSEKVVLGCVIEEPTLLASILAVPLCANDFMLSDHRRMFQAVLDLRQLDAPIDYISVVEQLGNSVEDFALVGSLIDGVAVESAHALHHSKIVRKKAHQRELLKISEELANAAAQASADPELLISAAIEKLQAVRL